MKSMVVGFWRLQPGLPEKGNRKMRRSMVVGFWRLQPGLPEKGNRKTRSYAYIVVSSFRVLRVQTATRSTYRQAIYRTSK
ncbi:hypothetical protein NDU88_001085 [Pleurodeles waltl]|uniref:Uncharacterized protein n=1 Tax=Pleurodeles waltl TaxID=8319 RepID=A0AAV7WJE6_PLEWA|nr:hypothetical protein NDU88_001085 [Pleurodeles waltl]